MRRDNLPPQLFIIDATIKSVEPGEVKASFHDMQELGLAEPPYDVFDVQCLWAFSSQTSKHWRFDNPYPGDIIAPFRIRFLQGEPKAWFIEQPAGSGKFEDASYIVEPDIGLKFAVVKASFEIYEIFLVLLSTRNVVKETKESKAAKLGIGHKHRYVTTLKIGAITERHESVVTGRDVRPHLRRGHIRNQKYGPSLSFVRKVWINPVFVNADKEWVGEREHYNVSLAQPTPAE
jgi:hypothetical protein